MGSQQLIYTLAVRVQALVDDHLQSGAEMANSTYFSYTIRDEGEGQGRSAQIKEIVEPRWTWSDRAVFWDQTWELLEPALCQLEEQLSAEGRNGANGRSLVQAALQNVSTERRFVKWTPSYVAATCVRDLDQCPQWWTAKTYLRGMEVSQATQLSDWLRIEPISRDDIASIRFSERRQHDAFWCINPGDSVLQARALVDGPAEIQRKMHVAAATLRTWRCGSVRLGRTWYEGETFQGAWGFGHEEDGWAPHVPFRSAVTSDPERSDLTEYFGSVYPRLSDEFETEILGFRNTPLGIALTRYSDAVLAKGPSEQQISRSMAALEALLLKPDEAGAISRRLGQRTAALLREFGENAVRVDKDVREAYNIRSRFVHGSHADATPQHLAMQSKRAAELTCLVIKVLLRAGQLDKESLLPSLDKSLLDEKSRVRLQNRLGLGG